MKFKHVSNIAMLESALWMVNQKFGGNIQFYEKPYQTGNIWNVRLTVVKTGGPGTRIAPNPFTGKGRRVHAACWHVHGEFFRALAGIADQYYPMKMKKLNPQYKSAFTKQWRDCDAPWLDPNAGSIMYPVNASDCCDCEG